MGDRTPRLWVEALPVEGGPVTLSAESARHAKVLRLGAGDAVELFDGSGGVAMAVVDGDGRRAVLCHAEPRQLVPPVLRALTLIVGLTKGSKLDGVTRMCTELGVDGLLLATCERSVPDPRDAHSKVARLARISLEACAQSGRARAIALSGPAPLLTLAAQAPADATRLVCWERAHAPLPTCTGTGDVWAVVGPEGGLSSEEVRALGEMGYVQVGLGAQILRAETAAPVLSALLLDRMGRLSRP